MITVLLGPGRGAITSGRVHSEPWPVHARGD